MGAIDLEIKRIIGELSEVNSKNEQKVVAIASWGGREDTIDIRKYNIRDEILLKGISLTPYEAEQMIYMLIESGEVPIDRNHLRTMLDYQEDKEVAVEQLVNNLDNTSVDAEERTVGDESELVGSTNGFYRIMPKSNASKVWSTKFLK